ncbi:MAG: DUF2269 family protein [Bacteroidetes bacterium]|nr:DUF2269 family protein [Bacteroidota bacterium]
MKTATKISITNGILVVIVVLLEYTRVVDFSMLLSYQWHKILHIFGASLFIANMIVGPIWFFYAYYSREKALLQFADKLLRLTDITVTIPGLDLAVINGLFLASVYGGSSDAPWLQYSVFLMIVMWLLTIPLLFIQEKIYKVIEFEPDNRVELQKWIIRWSLLGSVVMIPPTIVFYLMIVKSI